MAAGRVEHNAAFFAVKDERYTTCADGNGMCGIDERMVGRGLESKFLFLEESLFLSLIARTFHGKAEDER